METKKVMRIVFATAFLLCVPLVAMQFTDDVKWGPFDFLAAGVLLAGTGFTYEFVASKGSNVAYRIAVGIALGAALLLVWINLAVGIIGDEDHPANLLYLGVLVVGFIGALIALRASWNGARVVRGRDRSSIGSGACVDHLDTLQGPRMGQPWRGGGVCIECGLRRAVCRIGAAISTRGAGARRTGLNYCLCSWTMPSRSRSVKPLSATIFACARQMGGTIAMASSFDASSTTIQARWSPSRHPQSAFATK
jgi:hypothetical protein